MRVLTHKSLTVLLYILGKHQILNRLYLCAPRISLLKPGPHSLSAQRMYNTVVPTVGILTCINSLLLICAALKLNLEKVLLEQEFEKRGRGEGMERKNSA